MNKDGGIRNKGQRKQRKRDKNTENQLTVKIESTKKETVKSSMLKYINKKTPWVLNWWASCIHIRGETTTNRKIKLQIVWFFFYDKQMSVVD